MTPRAERIRGWGFAAPALLWTVAFFVVPFLVMGAMSLATLEGRSALSLHMLMMSVEDAASLPGACVPASLKPLQPPRPDPDARPTLTLVPK